MKLYTQQTHDEQVVTIQSISDYMAKDLPMLIACGRYFDGEARNRFFYGIELLSCFTSCAPFCRQAMTIRSNFDQYTNRMATLFDIVKQQIATEMAVRTASGEQVIVLSQAQSLRRGRPTAAESEQREKEKADSIRAAAIAKLTGAKIITQEAAPIDNNRPSDTTRRKKEEPSLFDVSAITDNNDSTTIPSEELKSLRDWIWILPDPMPSKIKNLRDTRAEVATAAEQAKRLFEQGASENEIAVFTQKAKQINRDIADLYNNVDRFLAMAYIMLTEVNEQYGKWAYRYDGRGGYPMLVSDLKPYYTKLSDCHDELLKKAIDENEATKRDPEKEKELHKIKAYFSRKDVAPTVQRLNKMKAYYQRAVELNADNDTLSAFKVYIDSITSALS